MKSRYERQRECDQVNKILMADAKRQGLGTKSSQAHLEYARQNDSTDFSRRVRLEIREYIRRALERHDTLNAAHVKNNIAYLLRISQQAAQRHMDALSSDHGPFIKFGDLVMLNPDYKPAEVDDYWQDTQEQEDA